MTKALYFQYILTFPNTYWSFSVKSALNTQYLTFSHMQAHMQNRNNNHHVCEITSQICPSAIYMLYLTRLSATQFAESKWCEDKY